jgi:hypothetical protein
MVVQDGRLHCQMPITVLPSYHPPGGGTAARRIGAALGREVGQREEKGVAADGARASGGDCYLLAGSCCCSRQGRLRDEGGGERREYTIHEYYGNDNKIRGSLHYFGARKGTPGKETVEAVGC